MAQCKNRIRIILKEAVRKTEHKTKRVWYEHKKIHACIQGDDYYECNCNT